MGFATVGSAAMGTATVGSAAMGTATEKIAGKKGCQGDAAAFWHSDIRVIVYG